MTCLAVCAAIRPKSSGVTSRFSIWSSNSARRVQRDLRRLGDDDLAGLGIDAPLELAGRLLLGLVEQLVLELLGQDQLLDAVLAEVGIEVHARVAHGAGLLLVCRQERVLEGGDELLLGDALLPGERADGFDDLL